MADTRRELAALQTLLADNTVGAISPQDARDELVSSHPDRAIQAGVYASRPASGRVTGDLYFASDNNTLSRFNGATWDEYALAGSNTQEFTASGTWTKPLVGTKALVICVGAGGGGGGGRKGAAGSNRYGGGGGAGGGVSLWQFRLADLSATETVTIGGSGSGGAGSAGSDGNGGAGVAGSDTTFGTKLKAVGGLGGGGGSATDGLGGAGSAGVVLAAAVTGTTGGASSVGATAATGGASTVPWQSAGGGAGGGIDSADVERDGGVGGAHTPALVFTALTDTGGANGTAGSSAIGGLGPAGAAPFKVGAGGGGGGGNKTGNGADGGGGGSYGGGGGGGGATVNASTRSGIGGAGAGGYCLVVCW